MKTIMERMMRELDVEQSMNHVRWLTKNTPSRISGTGQDKIAAEYICGEMKSYGCEAKILEFETYNSRPGCSEMKLILPREQSIASLPCCHINSTPPEGLTLELVYLGSGSEEEYAKKDVVGKAVLVEVSYAPATPEKAMIAARHGASAMICMNWGQDQDVICMRGLKGVWGNPTPESYYKIPQITGCSVTRKAGEDLRELCLAGNSVKIHLKVTGERLWEKLSQPIGYVCGTEQPEKFLLVSAHLDAWEPGVTDNNTGIATQLEMARVFAKYQKELKRSICFVNWNGHEIAEASGSTWFADTYWDQLSENCVGYINIDSTGMVDATQYEADASRELKNFVKQAVKTAIDEDITPRSLGKIGDQSFFGLGLPSIFGRVGFTEENIKANYGATLGWWNHTIEDNLDKVDIENLNKDNRVSLAILLGLVNSDILPYDFMETANDIYQKIVDISPSAEGIIDISVLLDNAKVLCKNIECLNEFILKIKSMRLNTNEASKINEVLLKLSRILTGPFYTASSRYAQDSYGLSILAKPLPHLHPITTMRALGEKSLEYRLLHTQMLRNRNMLSDTLRAANECVEVLLRGGY